MMRSLAARSLALMASMFVVFTLVSVDFAEARRGGSFGSRGTRTFQSAPPTRTAPNEVAPVQRTMTPNQAPSTRQNPAVAQQRPGLFGGMSGMMRGLVLGGLIGVLLGYGFGGMAGALGFVLQLLLLLMVAWLVMTWLRSRQQPVAAGHRPGPGYGFDPNAAAREANEPKNGTRAGSFNIPSFGGSGAEPQSVETRDLEISQTDLDTFERRLGEVQAAFASEDHAALRRLSTPEMVSYFSEELAENAKRGVRNDVSDVRLVQADIAEAWSEGSDDYATAAFGYESVEVMRDRQTGDIVEGDGQPSETVELWTFVRARGDDWKLSAIQTAN